MGLIRQLASGVAGVIYRPSDDITAEYHKWYYGTLTWQHTTWMGVTCWKSVSDMWNYQEILWRLRPSLVIEFGTYQGASAMFFATIMRAIGKPLRVLSVDISHKHLHPSAKADLDIEFMESSSVAPAVGERITQLRGEYPGPVYAILDSDHSCEHVLAEMKLLRPLLVSGDYLVVEDSNVNGHPVLPGFGPGPFEAIQAYEAQYPDDYAHDRKREERFGGHSPPTDSSSGNKVGKCVVPAWLWLTAPTHRHDVVFDRCIHRRQGGHVLGVIGREKVRVDRQRRGDFRVPHEPGNFQRRDTGSNTQTRIGVPQAVKRQIRRQNGFGSIRSHHGGLENGFVERLVSNRSRPI